MSRVDIRLWYVSVDALSADEIYFFLYDDLPADIRTGITTTLAAGNTYQVFVYPSDTTLNRNTFAFDVIFAATQPNDRPAVNVSYLPPEPTHSTELEEAEFLLTQQLGFLANGIENAFSPDQIANLQAGVDQLRVLIATLKELGQT